MHSGATPRSRVPLGLYSASALTELPYRSSYTAGKSAPPPSVGWSSCCCCLAGGLLPCLAAFCPTCIPLQPRIGGRGAVLPHKRTVEAGGVNKQGRRISCVAFCLALFATFALFALLFGRAALEPVCLQTLRPFVARQEQRRQVLAGSAAAAASCSAHRLENIADRCWLDALVYRGHKNASASSSTLRHPRTLVLIPSDSPRSLRSAAYGRGEAVLELRVVAPRRSPPTLGATMSTSAAASAGLRHGSASDAFDDSMLSLHGLVAAVADLSVDLVVIESPHNSIAWADALSRALRRVLDERALTAATGAAASAAIPVSLSSSSSSLPAEGADSQFYVSIAIVVHDVPLAAALSPNVSPKEFSHVSKLASLERLVALSEDGVLNGVGFQDAFAPLSFPLAGGGGQEDNLALFLQSLLKRSGRVASSSDAHSAVLWDAPEIPRHVAFAVDGGSESGNAILRVGVLGGGSSGYGAPQTPSFGDCSADNDGGRVHNDDDADFALLLGSLCQSLSRSAERDAPPAPRKIALHIFAPCALSRARIVSQLCPSPSHLQSELAPGATETPRRANVVLLVHEGPLFDASGDAVVGRPGADATRRLSQMDLILLVAPLPPTRSEPPLGPDGASSAHEGHRRAALASLANGVPVLVVGAGAKNDPLARALSLDPFLRDLFLMPFPGGAPDAAPSLSDGAAADADAGGSAGVLALAKHIEKVATVARRGDVAVAGKAFVNWLHERAASAWGSFVSAASAPQCVEDDSSVRRCPPPRPLELLRTAGAPPPIPAQCLTDEAAAGHSPIVASAFSGSEKREVVSHIVFSVTELAPVTDGGAGVVTANIIIELLLAGQRITVLGMFDSSLLRKWCSDTVAAVTALRSRPPSLTCHHVPSLVASNRLHYMPHWSAEVETSRKIAAAARFLYATSPFDAIEVVDFGGMGYELLRDRAVCGRRQDHRAKALAGASFDDDDVECNADGKTHVPESVAIVVRLHGTLEMIDLSEQRPPNTAWSSFRMGVGGNPATNGYGVSSASASSSSALSSPLHEIAPPRGSRDTPTPLKYLMERYVLERADWLLPQTPALENVYAKTHGLGRRRMLLAPPPMKRILAEMVPLEGVDGENVGSERWTAWRPAPAILPPDLARRVLEVRRRTCIAPACTLFLVPGKLQVIKGTHVIIDAVRKLLAGGPSFLSSSTSSVHFVFFGYDSGCSLHFGSPMLSCLSSGLPAGSFTALPRLPRAAYPWVLGALAPRAAVIASTFETFNMVAHEMLALRVPLILSDIPAFLAAASGATAFARVGDAASLAQALVEATATAAPTNAEAFRVVYDDPLRAYAQMTDTAARRSRHVEQEEEINLSGSTCGKANLALLEAALFDGDLFYDPIRKAPPHPRPLLVTTLEPWYSFLWARLQTLFSTGSPLDHLGVSTRC